MYHLNRSIIQPSVKLSSFHRNHLAASMHNERLLDLAKTDAKRLPLAKVVATIGPASEQLPMLTLVTAAGLNIMRLNFSHATYEEAELRVTNLKLCKPVPNIRAVMLDTQGPEIRTGSFDGAKEVDIVKGQAITLTTDSNTRSSQTPSKIWISYEKLTETVKPEDIILLDDGAIELRVTKVSTTEIECIAMNNGTLGNKKGVNLPGLKVDLPAMSAKDKKDIRWGIKHDIDFIAASFVRKARDIIEIREYVAELMKELSPVGTPAPRIIAKIESIEALQNFEEILKETDAVMVARGDLGVEIPMETLANVQKDIVSRCNIAGVPVVVATQMLESMQKNPRPTRAECTDVANAIFDGADSVMLSGESAKGKYPVKSVETMRKIVVEAERFLSSSNRPNASPAILMNNGKSLLGGMIYAGPETGMGSGVVEKSRNIGAKCIIVIPGSDSSSSATDAAADAMSLMNISINISRFRPNIPIVTFVTSDKHAKLLQIHRSIYPVLVASNKGSELHAGSAEDIAAALDKVVELGFAGKGDSVVMVSTDAISPKYSSAITTRALFIE